MTQPTFSAQFLRDGSTSFKCRETGIRYIVAEHHNSPHDCGTYREGHLITTGPRAHCVHAVESDARWTLRAEQVQ